MSTYLSVEREMVLHSGPSQVISVSVIDIEECRHMFLVFRYISETYVYKGIKHEGNAPCGPC